MSEDRPEMAEFPEIIAAAREEHAEATSTASTIVRALSLGAIATVWLFAGSSTSTAEQITKSIAGQPALAWALVLAVMSALLDVAHYLLAATLWGSYAATWGRVWLARHDKAHRRLRWRMASFFDIDEYVIEAATNPTTGDLRRKLLRLEARGRKKHAAEALAKYPADSSVVSYLSEPVAPRWISGVISTFFFLKVLAALASYVALLTYFLPLLVHIP